MATCLLLEVMDPKKATSDYLSKCNDALAEKNDDADLQLRINAMVERERLEDNGIGDELMEMRNALAD